MPERVVLFLDAQNIYQGARASFGIAASPPHVAGQIDPLALGELICNRGPGNSTRHLEQVRIYTGRPDASKQPKAYAAHMRQCAVWEHAGAVVIPRTLQYPRDWPSERPREKGVDVQLAIDFIAGAISDLYDVGVIFSTDTDLRPGLEFVAERFQGKPRAESAAWKSDSANRALFATSPKRTWCHFLTVEDYLAIHDARDYNVR